MYFFKICYLSEKYEVNSKFFSIDRETPQSFKILNKFWNSAHFCLGQKLEYAQSVMVKQCLVVAQNFYNFNLISLQTNNQNMKKF